MQGLISSVGSLESGGGGGGGSSLYMTYIKTVGSQQTFRIISFLSDGSVTNLSTLLSFIRTKGLSITISGETVICLPCMCGGINSVSERFPHVEMLYCQQTGNSVYYANSETHAEMATSSFSYSNVQLI